MKQSKGLVSLVSGSSSGIGFQIAKKLAVLHGHSVVITGSNKDKLKRAEEEIVNAGGSCSSICVDLSEINPPSDGQSAARKLFEFTLEKYGGIDRLVCCAGVLGPISKIGTWNESISDGNELPKVFQVNVVSAMQLCHFCLPFLRKSKTGGRILFVSSGAANRGIDGWSPYCTSKAALLHFATCLDTEEMIRTNDMPKESSDRVGVLSVRPGVVDTDMQTYIREQGSPEGMKEHKKFVDLKENNQLESPEKIGEILSCLTDSFPYGWSGTFKSYNDADVTEFVQSILQQGNTQSKEK